MGFNFLQGGLSQTPTPIVSVTDDTKEKNVKVSEYFRLILDSKPETSPP